MAGTTEEIQQSQLTISWSVFFLYWLHHGVEVALHNGLNNNGRVRNTYN